MTKFPDTPLPRKQTTNPSNNPRKQTNNNNKETEEKKQQYVFFNDIIISLVHIVAVVRYEHFAVAPNPLITVPSALPAASSSLPPGPSKTG